mmetsp:Transcript_9356/g.11212  ORF Transcript_9356/g.11212 Transcript_9356/m.11212 type:complete len:317 (+) Transcript_9356:177-1127(+)
MAKERRRDASSDDDHNQKNYDAICHDSYNKGKDKSATLSCLLGIPGVRNTIITFTSDCQQNPTQAAKRILSKLIFYVWCTVVIISILSLLGIDVNPWNRMQGVTDSDSSASSISENWQNMLPEVFQSSSPVEVESTEEDDEKKEDDEDIPAQVLPVAPKQGNKVNKKLERQLACEELQCVNACNKKIKPKCAKSTSCRKERDKLCHRRCRKARCEDRCKDEPKFGYVEREQRMEKCKDDCTGPTATHNKCIKKCHSQFKPCKSRCHEIAHKFQCDRPELLQPPPPPPVSTKRVKETPTRTEARSSKKIAGEDPEMI